LEFFQKALSQIPAQEFPVLKIQEKDSGALKDVLEEHKGVREGPSKDEEEN
jgi:hypothetical protein